jgi:Tfp pilus assembly protein PilN
MLMWLCVLFGTALLAVGVWGGMKLFGRWSMQRDEQERAQLQEEWKRRAAERKARDMPGGAAAPAAEGEEEESGDNPPMY